MRAKDAASIETAASIPIDLEVSAKAEASIMRDGVAVDQEVRKPSTADLVVGAVLLHPIEQQLYTITQHNGQAFKIRRQSDGTEHDANLRQLKLCTFVVATTARSGT